MKGLGRLEEHDPRSLKFGVSQIINLDQPLRSRDWPCYLTLNQGQDQTCEGCAWTHELIAKPAPVRFAGAKQAYAFARDQIYMQATLLDAFSDNDRNLMFGSSTIGGAKAVQAHGYIKSYHWCTIAEEVAKAIGYKGPVVIGTNWYESMQQTSSTGFVYPKGSIIGGHATLLRKFDADTKVFTGRNSWGNWGINGKGDFLLHWDDLEQLLHEGGDACVPERRNARRLKPIYLKF